MKSLTFYVYTEEDKNNLIEKGYRFMAETLVDGEPIYLFANTKNCKLEFSEMKVTYSNKLMF